MLITTSPAGRAPHGAPALAPPSKAAFVAALHTLERYAARLLHRYIAAQLARECASPVRPLSRRGRWPDA